MDVFFDRLNPLILKSKKQNREIERALNLPKDAIYNWRNGVTKSYTRLEYIFRFAKYFNISPDYLRGLTDDPTPKDAAPEGGDAEIASDPAVSFADEVAKIIRCYALASPEKRRQILALAESAESGLSAQDADTAGGSTPVR